MVALWMPEGPPTEFQLKMKHTFVSIVSLQAVIAICRIVVGDVWGGLGDAIVAVMGGLAITEMSIPYTLYYGTGCAMNFVLDATTLSLRLTRFGSGYFDFVQPFLFNLASFAILAAVVTSFLGAIISLCIWRDYQRTSSEFIPLYGHAPSSFVPPPGPAPGAYGQGYGTGPQQSFSSSTSFDAFSGPGYRLSDNRAASIPNLPPPPSWAST